MNELMEKLKNIKNATQSQYEETIAKYSHDEVMRDLKEAGISKDDLSEEEFQELLNEQIKKSKIFAKGAMTAAGILSFLEFLG